MPVPLKICRAASTPWPPSQQPMSHAVVLWGNADNAVAISALGTMAVGAWMNSTAAPFGSLCRICSASP
ncbi:MAG: hypothetical protein BWX79_02883 [Alphaproteobacteria bacterium ADurb.Bin100]|nr:MAG: hypothetical protein BWX79_02883 [Alphaproteobacteria bacterium ADurb.Bin100]